MGKLIVLSLDESEKGIYDKILKESIRFRADKKEQLYTKDKTALNVILSDCTKVRTGGRYVYGESIIPRNPGMKKQA